MCQAMLTAVHLKMMNLEFSIDLVGDVSPTSEYVDIQ